MAAIMGPLTRTLSGEVMQEFSVVLRGYDREQVDDAMRQFESAMMSQDPFRMAAARDSLRQRKFDVRMRGYDRAQVDAAMGALVRALAEPPGQFPEEPLPEVSAALMDVSFDITLRGYDRGEVDVHVAMAQAALALGDPQSRANLKHQLDGLAFTIVLRGYDRTQVDNYFTAVRRQLETNG